MTGVVAIIFPSRHAKERAKVVCFIECLCNSTRIFFDLLNESLGSIGEGGFSKKKRFLLPPRTQGESGDPHCCDLVHPIFRLPGKRCAK